MSPKFRQKVAAVLLLVYVPVMFTLGLQHHDGPLYPLPVTLTKTTAHTVPLSSIDGFCMACHFASRHFFEGSFHIFSAAQNITFFSVLKENKLKLRLIENFQKRGPPLLSIS